MEDELPFPLSQASQDDVTDIPSSQFASSPLASSPRRTSRKPKKPPTVTPRRFNKFFTPRSHSSRVGSRRAATGSSGRQLRDITQNARNWGRSGTRNSLESSEDLADVRVSKRRRLLPSPPSSSPLKPDSLEPKKREDRRDDAVVYDAELDGKDGSYVEPLSPVSEDEPGLRVPIRRVPAKCTNARLLQREFGGRSALGRGHRVDHCVTDYRTDTANFHSQSTDVHETVYSEGRIGGTPFCTDACNTNPIIAVGGEHGWIRIIDSASEASFSDTYLDFQPHANAIIDLSFSPDDRSLAVASADKRGSIIDMYTQRVKCKLGPLTGWAPKQIRFQPDNDNICVTTSRRGNIEIWDVRCSRDDAVCNWFGGEAGSSRDDPCHEVNSLTSISDAHNALFYKSTATSFSNSQETPLTSLQFLNSDRSHLFLTASSANACVKLWDIRGKCRAAKGMPATLPVAATLPPEDHLGYRPFGITSLGLSTDGARFYALCRDNTIYAYSTNQLLLGGRTQSYSASPPDQIAGPLYGFRHPDLLVSSFYVKTAVRRAKPDARELIAVGGGRWSPIVFPTDEKMLLGINDHPLDHPYGIGRSLLDGGRGTLPIYNPGTVLNRGHSREVTDLTWTYGGDLISLSDDCTVRCWREDTGHEARDLRLNGEGDRYACGWADVRPDYDNQDD